MADWLTLGIEPTPEPNVEELRAGAHRLGEFLDGHPDAENQIIDIISRVFDGEVNTETAGFAYASLSDYLGEDAAYALAWVATGREPTDRIEALGETLPERSELVMRRVAALYARQFRNGYELVGEMPHAWRNFYREVYFDAINSRPLVRVRIEKMNGETMMIEGVATSILQLATNMLITIGFIRNVAGVDAFRPDILEGFLTETDTILDFLRPDEEASEEGAQDPSD